MVQLGYWRGLKGIVFSPVLLSKKLVGGRIPQIGQINVVIVGNLLIRNMVTINEFASLSLNLLISFVYSLLYLLFLVSID